MRIKSSVSLSGGQVGGFLAGKSCFCRLVEWLKLKREVLGEFWLGFGLFVCFVCMYNSDFVSTSTSKFE